MRVSSKCRAQLPGLCTMLSLFKVTGKDNIRISPLTTVNQIIDFLHCILWKLGNENKFAFCNQLMKMPIGMVSLVEQRFKRFGIVGTHSILNDA